MAVNHWVEPHNPQVIIISIELLDLGFNFSYVNEILLYRNRPIPHGAYVARNKRPKQGRRSRRSKQRPSLPAEARGNARCKTAKAIGLSRGTENSACAGNPLAVCGSQVESSQHKERLVGLAEAAAGEDVKLNLNISF